MHIWKVLKPSIYRRDCGTGAGGFQPGNSCAGGEGSGSSSNEQEEKEGHSGKAEEKSAKERSEKSKKALDKLEKLTKQSDLPEPTKELVYDLINGPDGLQNFVDNIQESMLADSNQAGIDAKEHASGLVQASVNHAVKQVLNILKSVPDDGENLMEQQLRTLHTNLTKTFVEIAETHNALVVPDWDPDLLAPKYYNHKQHADFDSLDMGEKMFVKMHTTIQASLGAVVSQNMFADNAATQVSAMSYVAIPIFVGSDPNQNLREGTGGYFMPSNHINNSDKTSYTLKPTMFGSTIKPSEVQRGYIVVSDNPQTSQRTASASDAVPLQDSGWVELGHINSAARTTVHELMHSRQHQMPDQEIDKTSLMGQFPGAPPTSMRTSGWHKKLTPGQKAEAQKNGVRDYGVSNTQEFLAACAEFLYSGKTISPKMWALYDKLNGPSISPRLRKARGGGKNPYKRKAAAIAKAKVVW